MSEHSPHASWLVLFAATLCWLLALEARAAPPEIRGLVATCQQCHGEDGVSAGATMPSIAGQPESYLRMVMQEWRTGTRFSTVMGSLLAGFDEDQINAMAAYFAALPWTPAAQELDSDLVAQGKIPAGRCARCHGLRGSKPRTEETPYINGQRVEYLDLVLLKYRDEGLTFSHEKMQESVRKLKAEDLTAVSTFFASQR
ncbi:MAG: cytochrome c, class I [Sphingobacteriia bacterium]|nr:cytochrome c, class I [Sphingobacteriia bacterium]NCC39712.1 cytochrome c, class I [Gammaproteobacteria bacterium]